MYVAARMVLIPYTTVDHYHSIIADSQLDVSICSAVGVVRLLYFCTSGSKRSQLVSDLIGHYLSDSSDSLLYH